MSNTPKDIQTQVDNAAALQQSVEAQIAQLKAAQKDLDSTWKTIQQVMIDNEVKSIKGTWGSITIAEKQVFATDLEVLPPKFIKKAADTSKIASYYALEGKLPKGVERSVTKYLTKRIK